ncbi:MAG TPA: hypothetical protein VFU97_24340 [Xanthobacteraceae bacterium]|nr:hypothetical protein [Xanthobacteraceae bacterium]
MTRREELEAICAMLGKSLADELNDTTTGPPMGFLLMLFDFGPKGFNAYVSNANREDMIRLLREQIAHLEGKTN